MSISAKQRADGKEVTISIEGRLDYTNANKFKQIYMRTNPSDVDYIIDLQHARDLDSSALTLFLNFRAFAADRCHEIQIINCDKTAKHIFYSTGLNKLFTIH